MNKNGQVLGTGTMYLIYFLMMIIIAGGIYGGVISFFGNGFDIRGIEARSLMKSVTKCIRDNNLVNSIFTDENEFFQKCHFDKEVLESNNYLVLINNSRGEEFFSGVYDYKIKCGFDARFKKMDMPLCSVYCVDELCILTASAQISRRVAS